MWAHDAQEPCSRKATRHEKEERRTKKAGGTLITEESQSACLFVNPFGTTDQERATQTFRNGGRVGNNVVDEKAENTGLSRDIEELGRDSSRKVKVSPERLCGCHASICIGPVGILRVEFRKGDDHEKSCNNQYKDRDAEIRDVERLVGCLSIPALRVKEHSPDNRT